MKPRLLISSVAVFLLFSVLAKAETGPTDCASMPEAEKSQCLLQAIENLIVAGDLQAATPLAFEAMEAAQKSSSPHLRYKAHLQMGRLYFSKNDLTNAMRQYVQALRIANEEKQMAWTIEAKGHIGETFTTLEDYAQAEVNLQEALVLAQNEGLIDQSAAMHSQLGAGARLIRQPWGLCRCRFCEPPPCRTIPADRGLRKCRHLRQSLL